MKPVYCPGPNSPLTWIPNRGSRSQGGTHTSRQPLSGASTIWSGTPHSGHTSQSTVSGTHHFQGTNKAGITFTNVGCPTTDLQSQVEVHKDRILYTKTALSQHFHALPAASWGSQLGFCGTKKHQAISGSSKIGSWSQSKDRHSQQSAAISPTKPSKIKYLWKQTK